MSNRKRIVRMKPNHPNFIETVERKIFPIIKKEEPNRKPQYGQATKIIASILDDLEAGGFEIGPLVETRKNRVTLFKKKRRKK